MTSTSDLRSRLEADDGSLPERWNAEDEPGTTLVGTLLRFETIVTDYGQSPVAVIEDDDDGTVWGVALFRTVLKKRFDDLEPKPGDTVGIKYVGLVEPRNGAHPYHNYVLKVERGAAPSGTAPSAQVTPEEADDELPF